MKQQTTFKLLTFFGLLFFSHWAQAQCSSANFDVENCTESTQGLSGDYSISDPFSINYNFANAGNTFYIRSNTGNPWGNTTNQDAMNLAFGAGNWTEAFYETLDPAVVFSANTRFVFMEGSDSNASELNAFLIANLPAIENWVAAGRSLLLNAAPNEGGNINFGFGGSTLVYSYPGSTSANVTVVDVNHPAFLGPNLPTSANMSGGYYAHAYITGTGFTDLLLNDANGAITPLREKAWGTGTVMMGGMTTTNFHSPLPASANWRANLLVYLEDLVSPCPGNITASNDAGQCSAVVTYALNATFPPETIAGFTSLGSNNGKSYYLSDATFTPAAGYSDAIANGGFVATIQDAAKNAFINSQVNAVALGASVLIGFNDVTTEGTFVWQSGAPTTYTNWAVGEPNNFNGIEDYTELISNGLWNDQSNAFTARYVLEITGGFVQTAGLPSGSAFPVGTTTNTFDVTDANGNTTTCSFDVTVNDTEAPVITCPGDIIVDTDAGVCGATVTYDVVATDNCDASNVVVYQVPFAQLVNMNNTCGANSYYNYSPGVGIGFSWNSTENVTPVSIQVEFAVGVECSSGNYSTTLNGVANTLFPSTPTHCNCNGQAGAGSNVSFSLNPSGYISGGQNELLFYDQLNSWGLFSNGNYGAGIYAQVTVTYNTQTVTQTAGLPSGSVFPVGTTTNTFVTSDASGNTATCSFDVTVEDNEAPIALCNGSVPVYVGSYRVSDGPNWTTNPPVYSPQEAAALIFGGNASDYAISVNSNTSDPNTITNTGWTDGWGDGFAINPENYSLDVGNPGYNDPGGSATAVSAWVSDHVDFTKINYVWATSTSVVLQLDANGQATLDPALIDAGSTDNCGIASISVSPNNFTCADVGTNTVTLTVTDVNGNSSTCTSTVIVEDNVAPTAVCQNITVQLDANGNATITAADVDGGSSDACGIASTTIDIDTFDCSNVGPNNVILTITDNNGNVSTCTAVVTVEDNVAPIANCAAPFTIQLDANGNASITVADIENGSTDACGIASTSIDIDTFDCSDVGDNTVTLTVTDVNGNVSTCTTIVTVEDNEAPVANCAAPFTIQLDANGNASITVADIDNGSTDACGIASTTIDITDFDCSDVGPNTVTLTVTDVNGNTSTCTTVVTVEDSIAPTIVCPANITANTDAGNCFATVSFSMPIAIDNCGIATVVQTMGDPSGSQFPVGVSTIEFTATDVNGNVSTCSFTITVTDNEAPVAICQNITIQLDASGNATITAADVDGGSTDQCGVASIAIDIDTFDCSNVGDNNVILTVTDVNGNVSTCTAIVTVEDVTAPVVACQNITVELDPITGTITIDGTDIDNGSTDACGIASYDLDINTFDCSNIGDNTVVLTVTDVNGNTETCTAIVTVEDNTSPVLVCQDFTLELGADGTATLSPSDVIASNDDACGIFTTAVDITQFSCADIGTPVTVQVFSQDNNGNLATCTAVVTVVDNLAPVITCPADQTVDPGVGNLFYILPDYFAIGEATAVDNCTDPVTITTQDPAVGTPLSDGTYTITLTATDEYGNTSTCEFELVVESILGTGNNNQSLGTISMYPNPAKGNVTIGNPQSLALESATIYDLTGRLVQTFNLKGMATAKTLNVDNLAAATYVVIIKGKEGQITKRLIKE
ncbi:MAG: HYR domain-containing protein [Flavobacteriaceae bacterium]|nr:HYR domain-containing protein [Flavobacteriaceae bacterium]